LGHRRKRPANIRPPKPRETEQNDPRRSGKPSAHFALVRQPLQITRYIGANGSSWLTNAVFGLYADVLQTSFRAQTGPTPASNPAYAIAHARMLIKVGSAGRRVPVELCRLEFALLAHLARDSARVHEKHDLLRKVWGFRAVGSTRTADSPR
jgi:hypothetical protein